MRSARVAAGGHSSRRRPALVNVKPTVGWHSAICVISFETCADSAPSDFKNFRRAGTLKKRSSTVMAVPSGAPTAAVRSTAPPATWISVPPGAPRARVRSVKRATEAMLGKASPRKPRVAMAARSSTRRILLVAWRSRLSRASSALMPRPSSSTRSSRLPPYSMVTLMRRASASSEFSTSSFTTEAGRSTTSPAAIWLARSSGSFTMRVTRLTTSPTAGTRRTSPPRTSP